MSPTVQVGDQTGSETILGLKLDPNLFIVGLYPDGHHESGQ